jgi:hypothetical protein
VSTPSPKLKDQRQTWPGYDGHLLGDSLVATDFLHPRKALHQMLDDRHTTALRSLTTIGLPVDLIRLPLPHYLDDRLARSDDLPWTNVYIAADVPGSDMPDGDDVTAPSGAGPPNAVTIAGMRRRL